MKTRFSNAVIRKLKYYVYIYSHPVTGEIFYIGKGKGNRVFSHLDDKTDSRKVDYINDLKKQGLTPKIEILLHGLKDEKTTLRVESSVIDLIGMEKLTNRQSGFESVAFGRMTIDQVNALYKKQSVNIKESAILIRISQAFRYSMTDMELYDYTRGQWKLNPERATNAKYALAVYDGIVQEVYEVRHWYRAGATYSVRQKNQNIERGDLDKLGGRYEFIGNLAPAKIRNKYKFRSVEHYFKQGNSNPIMYVNG